MKKIGVILSGCGFKDGSEVHETVSALLAIDQAGAEAICMAPNIEFEVVDHLTFKPTGERRNVLQESARIARGKIRDLAQVQVGELDALILPGGFGAAKNLSNFALKGEQAEVHPEVVRVVKEIADAKKPIGVICIAPAALALVLGFDLHPTLTIGNDVETASILEKLGAHHQECAVTNIVIDQKNKIVSSPAYMYQARISEVFQGIQKLVNAVIEMA